MQGHPGKDAVFAGIQSFLHQVLMYRHPHIVFENMGNVIFAHIKFPGEGIQTQILLQMGVDVFTQIAEQKGLTRVDCRLFPLVYDAVDAQKKGCDITVQHGLVKDGDTLMFFDNIDQLSEQNLGGGKVGRKMMAADLIAVVITIENIRLHFLQTFKVFRGDPQDDSTVILVSVYKMRAVKHAGRNQTDIAVLERIHIFSDLIGEVPLQKEVNFIIIVAMHGHVKHHLVFVIKNFKVSCCHVLPVVKLAVIMSGHGISFLGEEGMNARKNGKHE